jgi:hypothetical protein
MINMIRATARRTAAVLLYLSAVGSIAIAATPTAKDDAFFPLMAWDDVRSPNTVKKMADCGINVIAFVPPKLLDACAANGVKAIVYDPRVTPAWDKPFNSKVANEVLPELIREHNTHPAVYGYHLKDEPDGGQFPELAKSAELVRNLAPGKWPYINLPPGMGDWYANEYLKLFAESCKPPVLSYDNYAIGENVEFSYGFWANIWDVRTASLRHDIPFHTIVLTAAHWNYRIPTAADLRLQVYGSIAYGAKGIGYYKFCSEPLSALEAPDLGNFRMAPLDEFGKKTETWKHLRNLNSQVRNIAPVLLKLHSTDVYHVGTVPERNHGIGEKSLLTGLEAGVEFIVGEFTHVDDGGRWMMIVNKSLKESAFCRPKFREAVKELRYVSPITGELKPFPAPWYALAPGQGVLLKL